MTEIRLIAPPHASRAALIARRPSTSRQVVRPRTAPARQDTVAMDWRRLRTIVDALLRRAAGSTDEATVIAASTDRAVVATDTTPQEQERIYG